VIRHAEVLNLVVKAVVKLVVKRDADLESGEVYGADLRSLTT
jgi:hypothetical protein